MRTSNPPVFDKCAGDESGIGSKNVRLVEVTLRYEVDGGRVERIVRVDPTECGGVLWTASAVKAVTRFRVMSRLARRCWREGSGRPEWVKIFQRPGKPAADEAPPPAPLAPLAMAMVHEPPSDEDSSEEELLIDSGNCYYWKGQIICC